MSIHLFLNYSQLILLFIYHISDSCLQVPGRRTAVVAVCASSQFQGRAESVRDADQLRPAPQDYSGQSAFAG